MSDTSESVVQLPSTLADTIKAKTKQGRDLIEKHLAIVERKAPFTDATVADVQRSIEWLSTRGWGKPKDETETATAASPFAGLTTEQLVTLVAGKAGGR